jgi:hypothetical protein
VRKAQRGQVAILTRERGKAVNHNREFLEYECESGAEEDEVCVATINRVVRSEMAGSCIALIVRTL